MHFIWTLVPIQYFFIIICHKYHNKKSCYGWEIHFLLTDPSQESSWCSQLLDASTGPWLLILHDMKREPDPISLLRFNAWFLRELECSRHFIQKYLFIHISFFNIRIILSIFCILPFFIKNSIPSCFVCVSLVRVFKNFFFHCMYIVTFFLREF